MVIYYIGHVCLRPYVYSFCQIFQAIWLYLSVHKGYLDGYFVQGTCVFKALCLFFLLNFQGPTFIPCPTFISCPKSIPEARVVWLLRIGGILKS